MILTPEEALTRQCCQRESQCIADACMAWRQHFVAAPVPRPAKGFNLMNMLPRPEPSGRGYCGLVYPVGA